MCVALSTKEGVGWNDSQKLRTSSSLQISGSVTLTIIFRLNIKGLKYSDALKVIMNAKKY
jgi:hypothetical protein